MDNIFLKPDNNVLLLWEYDNSNIINTDYTIVYDFINKTNFYASISDTLLPTIDDQLFLIDPITNTYSDKNLPNLQKLNYINVAATAYDKVKIYLPINYTFNDYIGFNITFKTLANDNTIANISTYYFDNTDINKESDIQILSTPLKYENRLWGKCIELNIPSVNYQSQLKTNNPIKPIPGSINFNLTGEFNGSGLSNNAPIIIDFNWIEVIKTENNVKKFVLSPKKTVSLPQAPSNLTAGVAIEHSTNGDYFEIYGIYGGYIADFATFMNSLELNGQKSYVIYTITIFEQGIQTSTMDFYVYKDFDTKIKYRPIFTFSNTTGSIQVELKIISYVDGSSLVKINEILLEPQLLSKYGNKLMSINVTGTNNINILNAKPEQLMVSSVIINSLGRRTQTQYNTVIRTVPLPISTNNILIKDLNNNAANYFKQDELEIILHPFDNYLKFNISNAVTSTSIEPLLFNNDSILKIIFKGAGEVLSVSTDNSHTENKPGSGTIVFNIKSNDISKLEKIFNDNNRFYITLNTDNNESVLYSGLFIISNSQVYLNRLKKTETPILQPIVKSDVIITKNDTQTDVKNMSDFNQNIKVLVL